MSGTGKYMGEGLSPWEVFCMANFPQLSKLLKHSLMTPDVIEFFINICRSQLDQRQLPEQGVPKRNDYLDVLIEGLKVLPCDLEVRFAIFRVIIHSSGTPKYRT